MELLLDPYNDRVVKDAPILAAHALIHDRIWSNGEPNVSIIRDHLLREGKIEKEELVELIKSAMDIMKKEPNVVMVPAPTIIVGDIHGQFYDLDQMFKKVIDNNRECPDWNLLFLGDYVDRGEFSVEVLIFLFSLKIKYPGQVTLLRGNHESRSMTQYFTFREEVLEKYDGDEDLYEYFMEAFESMPLAAEVNGDYLCVHGGISPQLETIEDINQINRFDEPGTSGFLCDLLWSDPCEDKESTHFKWKHNPERECAWKFGLAPVRTLLQRNNYTSIIRAHQVQILGYKMHRWEGKESFPPVVSVFSAPNYCGSYKNKGAVVIIDDDQMFIKQFGESKTQPYRLPDNIDLFDWSIPFISDNIVEMMENLMDQNTWFQEQSSGTLDLEDELSSFQPMLLKKKSSSVDYAKVMNRLGKEQNTRNETQVKKFNVIKTKLLMIARFNFMRIQAKKERERVQKIMRDCKLPEYFKNTAILDKFDAITCDIDKFFELKKMDSDNEKFPKHQFKKVVLQKEKSKKKQEEGHRKKEIILKQ